jgi:hypothetical protein
MLFRQGKRWGGASIKVIDPQRRLQQDGWTVTYVSNLRKQKCMSLIIKTQKEST